MSAIAKLGAAVTVAATCAIAFATPIVAQRGQQPPAAPVPGAAPAGAVLGVGTYIHLVSDANTSIAFYNDLLGPPANGNPAAPRVFAPNEVVSNLYNTPGSLFRGGTVRIGGTELGGAELVDWQTADRKRVQARSQDPGAATLVLTVRDIEVAAAAFRKNGASIVTPGGKPIPFTPPGNINVKALALLGGDPDGFLIQVMQFDPQPETTAPPTSNILGARLRITVADLDQAIKLYRDALGFEIQSVTPFADSPIAEIAGLKGLQSRRAAALVPGTAFSVEFLEYRGVDRKPLGADVHGVGSSVLRLRVKDIDATMAALKAAGVSVASANGQPVTFANGQRMAILSDPNGIFVQTVQAAPPQPAPQN